MQKIVLNKKITFLERKDDSGKTAVHYAVEENRGPMVEEMLKLGNNLACLTDADGLTPLHIAFKKGMFPMVKIIIENSPQSVEIRDSNGKTALHHAKMGTEFLAKCRTIDTRTMNSLINQVDIDGNTVLHLALINSKQDAAFKLLWFSGCNWGMRNYFGQNPFDICKSNDKISRRSAAYNLLSNLEGGQLRLTRTWTQYTISFLKERLYWFTLEEVELESSLSKIGVAAVLLLPLNFAAAFTFPGGYDSKGAPILRDEPGFHVYIISNMTAFFATVVILISCTFGFGKL